MVRCGVGRGTRTGEHGGGGISPNSTGRSHLSRKGGGEQACRTLLFKGLTCAPCHCFN